jgi:hypothetical protein
LLCQLIAPSIAGLIFDYLSYSWAAIFVALWNVFSVVVEYYLIYAIYKEYPDLSRKRIFSESRDQCYKSFYVPCNSRMFLVSYSVRPRQAFPV